MTYQITTRTEGQSHHRMEIELFEASFVQSAQRARLVYAEVVRKYHWDNRIETSQASSIIFVDYLRLRDETLDEFHRFSAASIKRIAAELKTIKPEDPKRTV